MHLGWSSNILQLNNRRSDLKLLVGSQRMHRCEPTSKLFFSLSPFRQDFAKIFARDRPGGRFIEQGERAPAAVI